MSKIFYLLVCLGHSIWDHCMLNEHCAFMAGVAKMSSIYVLEQEHVFQGHEWLAEGLLMMKSILNLTQECVVSKYIQQ